MQPSIPWSSSVSVFVIERMAIIHSLKWTVPFSFVVPLLSLAITHCHLQSLVVTRFITRCHSLSFFVPLVVTRCHSLLLVVPLVLTRCHWLSLDVPLTCLFINDLSFHYEFDANTFSQLLPFSIVLTFYILSELEVSWCILYLQHVVYCFISVALTFSIYKFCFA